MFKAPVSQDVVALIGTLTDDLGSPVILAGGACRDMAHGHIPKDYDLFMLADVSCDSYQDAADCSVRALGRIDGVGDVQVFQHYNEGTDVRLAYVIKFKYHGMEFDLIQYADPEVTKSPRSQCMGFDTNLNMMWMDRSGHVVVEPEALAVMTKQTAITRLNKAYFTSGDPVPRLSYLQSKYPEYAVDYSGVMTPELA